MKLITASLITSALVATGAGATVAYNVGHQTAPHRSQPVKLADQPETAPSSSPSAVVKFKKCKHGATLEGNVCVTHVYQDVPVVQTIPAAPAAPAPTDVAHPHSSPTRAPHADDHHGENHGDDGDHHGSSSPSTPHSSPSAHHDDDHGTEEDHSTEDHHDSEDHSEAPEIEHD